MIIQSKRGYYGTSEGYFISDDKIKLYYANDDKSIIGLNKFDIDIEYKKFKIYKDVIYYDHNIPYLLDSDKFLEIKTSEKCGFINFDICRWYIDKPLYSPGDSKDNILKLYSNIPKLTDAKKEYLLKLFENKNILIGDDAEKYLTSVYKNKRKLELLEKIKEANAQIKKIDDELFL